MSEEVFPPSPSSLNLSSQRRQKGLLTRREKIKKTAHNWDDDSDEIKLHKSQVNPLFDDDVDWSKNDSPSSPEKENLPVDHNTPKPGLIDSFPTQFLEIIKEAESGIKRRPSMELLEDHQNKRVKVEERHLEKKGTKLNFETDSEDNDSLHSSDNEFHENEDVQEQDLNKTLVEDLDISGSINITQNINQLLNVMSQKVEISKESEENLDQDTTLVNNPVDEANRNSISPPPVFKFGDEPPPGAFLGFQTGFGKEIKLNQEEKNAEMNLFEDSDDDIFKDISSQPTYQRPGNSSLKPYFDKNNAREEIKIEKKKTISDEDSNISIQSPLARLPEKIPEFVGFQFMNGKGNGLTSEDMERGKKIMEQVGKEVEKEMIRSDEEESEEEIPKELFKDIFSQENRAIPKFQSPVAQFRTKMSTPFVKKLLGPTISQEISVIKDALSKDSQFFDETAFFRNHCVISPIVAQSQKLKTSGCSLKFRMSCLTSKITSNMKIKREKIIKAAEENVKNKANELKRPFVSDFIKKKLTKNKKTIKEFVENQKPITSEEGLNIKSVFDFKFKLIEMYDRPFILEAFENGLNVDHFTVIMNKDCEIGFDEILLAFQNAKGIDPSLISKQWIRNAYELIVWKLMSMEVSFPQVFKNQILTIGNLLNELHFRYYKEIDMCNRSIIRRFMEKDDIPSKLMVLLVAEIERDQIFLSDGWYKIPTTIDFVLQDAISNGKVRQGSKLIIDKAELANSDKGFHPLEAPEFIKLKIHGNSTRRCLWDTKLGVYTKTKRLEISLNNVKPNGGLISAMKVRITRKYPLLFVSEENSNMVFRSEKMEMKRREQMRKKEFDLFQHFYHLVKMEIEKEEQERLQELSSVNLSNNISELEDAEEIDDLLQSSHNPSSIEEKLSPVQKHNLIIYRERQLTLKEEKIQNRVREKMAELNNFNDRTLLKIRVESIDSKSSAILSIWQPSEELITNLVEGKTFYLENVIASGMRNQCLQLNTGKKTLYKELKTPEVVSNRTVTKIHEMISSFTPKFEEFDTIGVVIKLGSVVKESFQQIFIVDHTMAMICVNFWNGVQNYSFEDLIKVNRIICLSNLQWRKKQTINSVPNGYCTEMTVITANPKNLLLKKELDKFQKFIKSIDLEEFNKSVFEKYSFLKNLPQVVADKSYMESPMRFNRSSSSFKTPGSAVNKSVALIKTPLHNLNRPSTSASPIISYLSTENSMSSPKTPVSSIRKSSRLSFHRPKVMKM